MRFKIAREWLRRGKPGEFEDFVKVVCEAQGIKYEKQKPLKRR